MQTHEGPRSDEPPGRRSFRRLMNESHPFRGMAVPGDEKVPSEPLLQQSRQAAGLDTDVACVPWEDLLFGLGMGVC